MLDQDEGGHRFNVLFVCTGNICRSPIGEQLLRARTPGLESILAITSAGTSARPGEPMTAQAMRLSRDYGGYPDTHRASQLSASDVRRAGLVLTATRQHRAEVVSLVPRASRLTFTLREFARLLSTYAELEPDRLASTRLRNVVEVGSFVGSVSAMRGFSRTLPTMADDDVIDPYRRPQEVYEQAGALIDAATAAIASALMAVTRFGSPPVRDEASQNDTLWSGPTSFRSAATGE